MKSKDYTLNLYADGFRRWHCQIFFTVALGNTGEADKVFANAMRAAKRTIREAVIYYDNASPAYRHKYEVTDNRVRPESNRLVSLTVSEKQ